MSGCFAIVEVRGISIEKISLLLRRLFSQGVRQYTSDQPDLTPCREGQRKIFCELEGGNPTPLSYKGLGERLAELYGDVKGFS
jgi:hypothetical protein